MAWLLRPPGRAYLVLLAIGASHLPWLAAIESKQLVEAGVTKKSKKSQKPHIYDTLTVLWVTAIALTLFSVSVFQSWTEFTDLMRVDQVHFILRGAAALSKRLARPVCQTPSVTRRILLPRPSCG